MIKMDWRTKLELMSRGWNINEIDEEDMINNILDKHSMKKNNTKNINSLR